MAIKDSTYTMADKDPSWDWAAVFADLKGALDDPDEVMDLKFEPETAHLILITKRSQVARLTEDGKVLEVYDASPKPNRLVVGVKGNVFPPDVCYSIGNDSIDIDGEGNYWKTSFGGGLWVKNQGYPEPNSNNRRIRDIAFNPQKDAFFLAGDYTQYFLMRDGPFKCKVKIAGHEYSYTAYSGEKGKISVADSAVTRDNIIYVVGFHGEPRIWKIGVTEQGIEPRVILEGRQAGFNGISDIITVHENIMYLATRGNWPKTKSIDRYFVPRYS